MQFVRRAKNHPAGADLIGYAVLNDFKCAFFDDQQFLLGMPVCGMRLLAGIQRRNMAGQIVEGGRRRIKNVSQRADIGWLCWHVVPLKYARVHGRLHRARGGAFRRRIGLRVSRHNEATAPEEECSREKSVPDSDSLIFHKPLRLPKFLIDHHRGCENSPNCRIQIDGEFDQAVCKY